MDNKLNLTGEEIKNFGSMCYINEHYKCIDYDKNDRKTLNIVGGFPKKYECGCKVIIYDNFVGDEKSRNVHSSRRIIKNKIIKANNCETHQIIVNKRKKLLKKLKKLENKYDEIIPRVVRTINKDFYYRPISDDNVITETVEID